MSQKPSCYVAAQIAAGKFPAMTIQEICGDFYLGDSDWNILGASPFKTRRLAEAARSEILARAIRRLK